MPASSRTNACDYRWIFLVVLSLCISLFAYRGNLLGKFPQKNTSTNAAMSWSDKGLRWDHGGCRGPGVYRVAVEAADSTIVSPRLAVFIFRPYDLNQVDVDTLQIIKGIGPKLAAAIVNHRQVHGPFDSLEELLDVKGIGRAKLASLRDYLALPPVQP